MMLRFLLSICTTCDFMHFGHMPPQLQLLRTLNVIISSFFLQRFSCLLVVLHPSGSTYSISFATFSSMSHTLFLLGFCPWLSTLFVVHFSLSDNIQPHSFNSPLSLYHCHILLPRLSIFPELTPIHLTLFWKTVPG